MHNAKPCPFFDRCAFAKESCSEELSGTCPVIAQPVAAPAKVWDPLEPAAVTLTREQWQIVLWKLEYCMNVSQAKEIEYTDHPAHAVFAETAARHKAEAEKTAGIIEKIQQQIQEEKPHETNSR